MKHNSVWGKLLLLALSFVLAFSTLVSCTKDDVAALDEKTEGIQTSLSTTAEDLANLKTLVNSIKATADAAATKTALEEAAAAIASVKTTADAAATAAALATVKADLEAALATNGAADATTKDALKDAIEAVEATADAAATKAALEKAIADADDADAALKTELEGKITALNLDGKIAALKTELEGKIAAVAEKVTALETLVADYEELKASVDAKASSADVDALKKDLAKANEAIKALQDANFEGKYKEATETLYRDVEGNDYSMADWNALVASVDEDQYTDAVYANFQKEAETLKFFLARALTVEDIKDQFAALDAYIKGMDTFEMTLSKIVTSYECGKKFLAINKATTDTMTEMKQAYEGATNVGLTDTTLTARYNKIVAAYENLVAADEASVAIETLIEAVKAIETIVYEDSKETISNAVDAFSMFEHTYFQTAENAAHLAYYEAKTTDKLAADLVKGYDDMRAAEARYYELCDAWDNRVVLSETALGYNTARPLYTKAASLADELKAVKDWIAKYELEDENVAKLYAAEYDLITKASAYAADMAEIFETLEVAKLNARIAALIAIEDNLIYNSLDEAKAIADLVEDLGNAIADVDNYAEDIDGNFLAMLPDYDELEDTCERLMALIEADEIIAELAEDIADFWSTAESKYVVGFSDYDAIKAIKAVKDADVLVAGIDWVCEHYDIAKSDVANSNYMLIVDATQKAYDNLFAAYEALTAELRDAYNEAIGILDNEAYNAEYPIPYANESIKAIKIVREAIQKYGVANADIKLPGTVDGEVEVNFTTLLLRLSEVAVNIASKGAIAESKYASDVAGLIAAMKDLDAKKLDNKDEIDAAYAAIVLWAKDCLGVADGATDAQIKAAVAAVQGMKKYDGKNNDKAFALLTSADLDMVIAAKDTAKTTYDAAETEWNALKVEIARLTAMTDGETYSIHTKDAFAAGEKAYNDYRAKYYVTGSVLSLFEEVEAKEDFDETYAAFNIFYGEAEDLAEEIIDRINALPADLDAYKNVGTANATLTEADAIIALINNFNARFDKDHEGGCNKWFVVEGEDLILAVNKAKYMAQTMIEADAANLADQAYNFIHSFYVVDMISNATSVSEVESYYNLAKSDIEAKTAVTPV